MNIYIYIRHFNVKIVYYPELMSIYDTLQKRLIAQNNSTYIMFQNDYASSIPHKEKTWKYFFIYSEKTICTERINAQVKTSVKRKFWN